MLSKKMGDALNGQIQWEMFSGYIYLAMSANCDSIGLKGFANWFMVQYKEEMDHAFKMYNYLLEQGADVELLAIDKPQQSYDSPLQMFEVALEHEQGVTKRINDLVDLAISEKDHATQIFLQWFVTEQVEEESNANENIDKLKLIKDNPGGLFMMDKDLAARVFTPITAEE
ncbi:ferritin [candidate division KSB1 bacterium]|nr:ferritin [candidate division KSB1 bacterium]